MGTYRGYFLLCLGLLAYTTGASEYCNLAHADSRPPVVNGCEHSLMIIADQQTWRVPVVENFHGRRIADPYRWLEDLSSKQTVRWVENQNEFAEQFLVNIPSHPALQARLSELWSVRAFERPFTVGKYRFAKRRNPNENQASLYVYDEGETKPRLLLDINEIASDHAVSLYDFRVSPNGTYVAYGLSVSGSDWVTWHIREVATGRDLPDTIPWTKFTNIAWLKDETGFFYSRYPDPIVGQDMSEPNIGNALYQHRLGQSSSADQLIAGSGLDPSWSFYPRVIQDGKFLLINVYHRQDNHNLVYLKYLNPKSGEPKDFIPVIDDFAANFRYLTSNDLKFWFLTNDNSPNGKIVSYDLNQPAGSRWEIVVPESDGILEDADYLADHWLLTQLKDGQTEIAVWKGGRHVTNIPLPEPGSVSDLRASTESDCVEFTFSSDLRPSTLLRFNLKSQELTTVKSMIVPFDPNLFEVDRVFYPSKDGTEIPMRIIHKKGLKLDGSNPTYLYGYGGFNHSLISSFNASYIPWLERGGVIAIPNLRGGGELGASWHEAGMRENKQNVFDDFIAAAEFLISLKITSPEKLAIGGASNGGLLVSAVLMQRPVLFGAGIPAVGVHDMLRFQNFTVGEGWVREYGSSEDPSDFQNLIQYSPLHNVRMGTVFPPTMIVTSDRDDRVVPSHSYKLAATMQAAQGGLAPILLRVNHRTGHGAGRPIWMSIRSYADQWAFLLRALGQE